MVSEVQKYIAHAELDGKLLNRALLHAQFGGDHRNEFIRDLKKPLKQVDENGAFFVAVDQSGSQRVVRIWSPADKGNYVNEALDLLKWNKVSNLIIVISFLTAVIFPHVAVSIICLGGMVGKCYVHIKLEMLSSEFGLQKVARMILIGERSECEGEYQPSVAKIHGVQERVTVSPMSDFIPFQSRGNVLGTAEDSKRT